MFTQFAPPFAQVSPTLRLAGNNPAYALHGQLLAAMARADKAFKPAGGAGSKKFIPSRARAKGNGAARLLETLLQANAQLARDAQRSQQAAKDAQEARHRQATFLVTIAHELRNPLLPLRLAARSLEGAHQDAARQDALLATINSQVDHIARLIGDLLDSTAADAGRLRMQRMHVDLDRVLRTAMAVCQPAMEAKHHAFTSSCTTDALVLDGDPVRLVQVFVNLLENAAKYTPEGGRVSLNCARRDGNAVVTITDNGNGISPAALPRLFEMYAREEEGPGGLGIGLALVKQLVTAHGGSVSARSAGKDQGSEFVVTLPCSS